MTATQLAARVAVIELVVAILTLAALFGTLFRRRYRRARGGRRREAGHDIVAAALARGEFTPDDLAVLGELPRSDLVAILAGYAPSIGGVDRERLAAAAVKLGLMDFAAGDIASDAWWRRLRGARLLALLGPTAGQLRALRGDTEPAVRAEAAVCASLWPTRANVAAMVDALGDPSPLVRFEARDGLMRLGNRAQSAVLDGLGGESGPAADLLAIGAAIATPEFLEPALRHSFSPTRHIRIAAIALLRAVAGVDALRRLVELLADPDSDVRAAAAEAVGALGDWRSGRALVPLLDDGDSGVRLTAAMALTALGPPGMLLLRDVAGRSSTAPGADVARQVLDVAATLALPATA